MLALCRWNRNHSDAIRGYANLDSGYLIWTTPEHATFMESPVALLWLHELRADKAEEFNALALVDEDNIIVRILG
jgi:hypothetical protein